MRDLPLIIMMEPEGAFRCNSSSCDWIDDPIEHARDVHGIDDELDVMVVHPDDH